MFLSGSHIYLVCKTYGKALHQQQRLCGKERITLKQSYNYMSDNVLKRIKTHKRLKRTHRFYVNTDNATDLYVTDTCIYTTSVDIENRAV